MPMSKEDRRLVAAFIRTNIHKSYHQIARELNKSFSTISRIAQEFEIHREPGPKTLGNL